MLVEVGNTTEAKRTEFRTLLKQLSQYLGGRVVTMLLGFITFPIFTRLFTVEQYGQISFVLTSVVFAVVFAKLGLQNSVYRYYEEHVHGGDPAIAIRFQSTIYAGTMCLGVVTGVLFLLIVTAAPTHFIPPNLKSVVVLGAGLVVMRAVQSIVLSLFQCEGRTGAYNTSDIATRLAVVPSILLLCLLWGTDPKSFVWGSLVGEGIVLCAGTYLLQRIRPFRLRRVDPALFGQFLAFSAPLAAAELGKIGLDLVNRFLLQFYMGSKAVGYFAAANNIASYLNASVLTPLGLTLGPMFMRLWSKTGKSGTAEFLSKILKYYFLLMGLVVSLSISCSADILTVLASAKYRQAHQLLPVLIAGMMVSGIHLVFNGGLFINGRTGLLASLAGLCCLLNIGMNCLLIPRYGLQGAAGAALVSYSAFAVIMAAVSTRYLPVAIPYSALLKAAGAGVVAFLCTRFDVGKPLWNCGARAAVGIVTYLLFIVPTEAELRAIAARMLARRRLAAAARQA